MEWVILEETTRGNDPGVLASIKKIKSLKKVQDWIIKSKSRKSKGGWRCEVEWVRY